MSQYHTFNPYQPLTVPSKYPVLNIIIGTLIIILIFTVALVNIIISSKHKPLKCDDNYKILELNIWLMIVGIFDIGYCIFVLVYIFIKYYTTSTLNEAIEKINYSAILYIHSLFSSIMVVCGIIELLNIYQACIDEAFELSIMVITTIIIKIIGICSLIIILIKFWY